MAEATIRSRWWPVLAALVLATTVLPARADLKLESQHLRAWVQLAEPDMTLSGPSEATWAMGEPPGPVTVVKAARGDSLAAAARQTPDGFFHAVTTLEQGWSERTGVHTVAAGTTHESLFTTNRPDTPLVLDFLFLGSRLEAGSYYGYGAMDAQVQLMIRAGIGNTTTPGLTSYWGFDDRLVLGGGGGFQARQANNLDIHGIGLPTAQADSGWRDMVMTGQLNRLAFSATLDFGLLQPGEYFALHYSSEVRIESNTPYATSARAEVIDPFGLRDDPPLQLSLQGLVLPAPVGVVPEPASTWLMLAGAGLLLAWPRGRRLARTPAVLVALGALLVPAGARADAGATVTGVVINARPGIFSSVSDSVSGSGTARVSDSQQVTSASGAALGWIAGAWGSTRRGAAGAEIVADRGTLQTRAQISATGVVSDALHIGGSRSGIAVFSAGVFGSFNSLSGTRFQADGTLVVSGPGGAESADVRFDWTKQIGSLLPSVVATEGSTGLNDDPATLSATLHVPLLVNPGDDVTVALHVNVFVEPGINDHAVANFGHTMQLAIALPEGLTYTSSSGDFMVDAQPLPVPEPASIWLMLAGTGLLAGACTLRRGGRARRRAAALALVACGLSALAPAARATVSARVSVGGIDSPTVVDVVDPQPERAQAIVSGGGPLSSLQPVSAGRGDFIVATTADLARGTLRGVAQLGILGSGSAGALTDASLSDQLVFSASGPVQLRLRMALHGAFLDSGSGLQQVDAALGLAGSFESARLTWTGWPVTVQHNRPVQVGGSQGVQAISTEAANTVVWLTRDETVLPGVQVDVSARLRLAANAGPNSAVQLNFGNTAQLWLELPEGVTYTSASGRFLSAAPVPEPAVVALWLAGLLLLAGQRRPRRAGRRIAHPAVAAIAALLLAASSAARATVLDYPSSFGNFYGDQPGVLDVHHRATHLGANVDGLQWWAGGYDDLSGVAWSVYNSAGTLGHVDLIVLDGQPLRLDGFRLGSWAGAEGRLETVTVTAIGSSAPAWQFTGLIGVGNLASRFDVGLLSATGFTITWTNPWWTAIDDIGFQTSAVPEPGAGWLWLAGLAGLLQLARRRRR